MKQFNLEEYIANSSKKLVTRDGRNVRIVCTDVKCDFFPVIALVDNGNKEIPTHYTKDGKFVPNEEYPCDLFFATEKREGWTNIFKNENVLFSEIYETQDLAKEYGIHRPGYVDTIKIEWEE